jgi:hypothetical protein
MNNILRRSLLTHQKRAFGRQQGININTIQKRKLESKKDPGTTNIADIMAQTELLKEAKTRGQAYIKEKV